MLKRTLHLRFIKYHTILAATKICEHLCESRITISRPSIPVIQAKCRLGPERSQKIQRVDVLQAIEEDSARVREQIENRGSVWQELIRRRIIKTVPKSIRFYVYYSARNDRARRLSDLL